MPLKSMKRKHALPQDRENKVYASLILSQKSSCDVRSFFLKEVNIEPDFILDNLHITIYISEIKIPTIKPVLENISLIIPNSETRFMVMKRGGEEASPDINPADCKVGIRIRRCACSKIYEYRQMMIKHETRQILGQRKRSNYKRNAFGYSRFQPHVTILEPGNNIPYDLKPIGEAFRSKIKSLNFNKFVIYCN